MISGPGDKVPALGDHSVRSLRGHKKPGCRLFLLIGKQAFEIVSGLLKQRKVGIDILPGRKAVFRQKGRELGLNPQKRA